MATFRKVGKSWRVEICVNGQRKSATRDTKAQAKEWAAYAEVDLKTKKSDLPVHTLKEALQRYCREETPKKRGAHWETLRINAFIRDIEFIDQNLEDITTPIWAKWRDDRLKKVSNSTVSREITIFQAMYSIARLEWHWVEHSPLDDVKRPVSPPPRERRISIDEREAICSALGYTDVFPVETMSQQIAVAFLFALETAMRVGEIIGLTWDSVSYEGRFVTIPKSKNGDTRQVPLSSRAVELLKKLEGIDKERCFTVDSRSMDTLFRKARTRASKTIPDILTLHFHDTRHEAITTLAKKLTVIQLARMVGHRDLKSLMIYYNETATELASLLN